MKNIQQMMRQAQEMQAKMAEMQARLAEIEVEGSAGAGMVTVRVSAKGDLKSVKIDPKIVDPAEVEMIEDLIVAAAADAKGKAEAAAQEETQKLMGGLKLPPGFKLPF